MSTAVSTSSAFNPRATPRQSAAVLRAAPPPDPSTITNPNASRRRPRSYRSPAREFQLPPQPTDKKFMRVIVVEDDTNLRTVLAAFFRSTGVEVLASATNGMEALDLLQTLRPDVIITDCQMPRMD